MRPTAIESIRAIQAALAEAIAPELSSAFAQDAAQTVQMLLESIASEWDTAAECLRRDNETLSALLSASRGPMMRASSRNEGLSPIVTDIENLMRREDAEDSVALSRLSSRNIALRESLECVLVAFEDLTGEADYQEVDEVRRSFYAHLRDVASRGWSFWDVSSFRGRMATVRSTAGEDDARGRAGVE